MNRQARAVRSGEQQRGQAEAPDIILVVRGASRGFTVLLIGGVVQPWVGVILAPLGYIWLALVAIGAFTWAAWPRDAGRVMSRGDRALIGGAAAICSYLLVLPLVVSAAGFVPWSQVIFTSATALATGAVTGVLAPGRGGGGADVRKA